MTSLALIFEKFPSALPSGVAHYITGPENPQAVKQKILDLFIAFMLVSNWYIMWHSPKFITMQYHYATQNHR